MEIEVGYSDRELSNDIPNELPYLLTRLLCEHVQSFSVMHDGDSVDIALLNYGGIRASLPQGMLTVGDFYRIVPFENLIVLLDIKGSELQKIVEVERKRDVAAFYGLQIAENNQKIIVNGKNLVPEETYRIVTVDFIASGGDNILKNLEFKQVANTMQLLRDGILEEVKKISARGEHIK
jgi:2',3'-cyclic-nucleotide 2'-phosphodiesterase (5'-nucleotidase family)